MEKFSVNLSNDLEKIENGDFAGLASLVKKAINTAVEYEAALDTANNLIDEQSKEIDRLKGAKPSRPRVTVGKKQYEVIHGVNGHSVKEISENSKLAADLVKSGSTALVEVVN